MSLVRERAEGHAMDDYPNLSSKRCENSPLSGLLSSNILLEMRIWHTMLAPLI